MEIKDFIKTSNEKIANYKEIYENLKSLVPFDQMTIEDYMETFPAYAPDFLNKPTFWPHNIEEQINVNHDVPKSVKNVIFNQIQDVQHRLAFKKSEMPIDVLMKIN